MRASGDMCEPRSGDWAYAVNMGSHQEMELRRLCFLDISSMADISVYVDVELLI